MIKSKRMFDNEFLSNLINDLSKSLDSSVSYNTNAEIDINLEQAKHDGCEKSMNWLLLQFMPLIASIASKDTFHKKNNFTGRNCVYTFDYIREEDIQDLVPNLIIEFKKLVKEFNWETPFNSWIKGQLEWYAINYHNNNSKYYQREITSLNSSYSDVSNNGEDDEEDFIGRTENDRGLWHKDLNQRDNLKDREVFRIISDFVKTRFDAKKQRIFKMHFLEDMSMSEIAIKEGYHYHSTISNLIKEIRFELMEYLSKIDEEYDEMYDKYFTKKYTPDELKDANCILSNIESFKEDLSNFDCEFEDFSNFTVKPVEINLNKHEIIIVHKLCISSVKDFDLPESGAI